MSEDKKQVLTATSLIDDATGLPLFINEQKVYVLSDGKTPGTPAKQTKDRTFDPTGRNNEDFYADSVVDRNALIRNLERQVGNRLVAAGRSEEHTSELQSH